MQVVNAGHIPCRRAVERVVLMDVTTFGLVLRDLAQWWMHGGGRELRQPVVRIAWPCQGPAQLMKGTYRGHRVDGTPLSPVICARFHVCARASKARRESHRAPLCFAGQAPIGMTEVPLGWDGLDVMYKTFALTFQTLMYGAYFDLSAFCMRIDGVAGVYCVMIPFSVHILL